ncbi:MAG TPA: hypothetical protein PLB05_10575, partial [Candidatus Omnitrophota bacterium]|nr:hypothetical protein [Candidatus Omnitrophota bacterium]
GATRRNVRRWLAVWGITQKNFYELRARGDQDEGVSSSPIEKEIAMARDLVEGMRLELEKDEDIFREIQDYLTYYSFRSHHLIEKVRVTSPHIVAFFEARQITDKTQQSNLLSVAQVVLDAFPRDASSSPITRREFLKYVVQGGIGISLMGFGVYKWMAWVSENDKAGMAVFEIMHSTSQESFAIKEYVGRVYQELYGAWPSEAAMYQPIQDILKALKMVKEFAPYIRQAADQYQVDEILLASVLLVENMDMAPLEKETDTLGSTLKNLTKAHADFLPEPSVGPFQMRPSVAIDVLDRFGGYDKYFGVADQSVRAWSQDEKASRFRAAVTELLYAKTDAGKSFAAHMAAGYLKFLITELGRDERRVLAGYTSDYKRVKTQKLYEGPFNTAFEKKVMADRETGALYAATRYAIAGIEAKELIRRLKLLDTSSSPLAAKIHGASPVFGEEDVSSAIQVPGKEGQGVARQEPRATFIHPLSELEAVFQEDVRKFTQPIEFGGYLFAQNPTEQFTHVLIPRTLGVNVSNLEENVFGWVRALPSMRKMNGSEESYRFGLQLYASPILPELERDGDRESFIDGSSIILAKDIPLAQFFSEKRLNSLFPGRDIRSISDEELAKKVVEAIKTARATGQMVIQNGHLSDPMDDFFLDEDLAIESYGTPRFLFPTTQFTVKAALMNQQPRKNLGFVHVHNSFPDSVRNSNTSEGKYVRALEKYVGPEAKSLTVLSPEDALYLIKSKARFDKVLSVEGNVAAQQKMGTRLTLSGILAFDYNSRRLLGQRWFNVRAVEKDAKTYDKFVDITAAALDTIWYDPNPDYAGAVNDYWQMMLELSQEGPLKVSSPVSFEEHPSQIDAVVPVNIPELLPVMPFWTLPALWPQMIQAPVPPADHKHAGRSRPWLPVVPVNTMTDILPAGFAAIDYSHLWTAVLSGIQGVQREILLGRLNEVFEIFRLSGKNYIHTGLSPPEGKVGIFGDAVVSSNIQVLSGQSSHSLIAAGIVKADLSQESVAGFVLVSSPVDHGFGQEETGLSHIQQAQELIYGLNIGAETKVVSVGPGDYALGSADRQNIEASWIPWERLFLDAGSQLVVYEPDRKA